jgi:hypothetical protein
MATPTIKGINRFYRVTPDIVNVAGYPFLEIGPAGTGTLVSTFMVQFNPVANFDGQFSVQGRILGQNALDKAFPWGPIPYRRVTLADTAQAYEMVADPILTGALIQIPANGLSVVLQIAPPSVGYCDICMWDLQGSSAV